MSKQRYNILFLEKINNRLFDCLRKSNRFFKYLVDVKSCFFMFLLLPVFCCTQQFGSTLKINVDFKVKTDFVVPSKAFFCRPYLPKHSIKKRPAFLLTTSKLTPFYTPIAYGATNNIFYQGKASNQRLIDNSVLDFFVEMAIEVYRVIGSPQFFFCP